MAVVEDPTLPFSKRVRLVLIRLAPTTSRSTSTSATAWSTPAAKKRTKERQGKENTIQFQLAETLLQPCQMNYRPGRRSHTMIRLSFSNPLHSPTGPITGHVTENLCYTKLLRNMYLVIQKYRFPPKIGKNWMPQAEWQGKAWLMRNWLCQAIHS